MLNLENILKRGENSAFARWLLNIGLKRMIPFNSPHQLKIKAVSSNSISITAPYIRKNKNHVNGIHACALATLCEYTCGLMLARSFSPTLFRVILKELKLNYQYQAKTDVFATYSLPISTISEIKETLNKEDATLCTCIVNITDIQGNAICTGEATWQIKPWTKTHNST